ncbi:TPA: hypothetical protein EYP38_04490 [Candidatus Micrarchaeota archaeon]|nr:hypothetical protein [Candidatus Micrarchaeota archaeon]
MEFWAGFVVFLVRGIALVIYLTSDNAIIEGVFGIAYGLFALLSWLYVVIRMVWIAMKKMMKITII